MKSTLELVADYPRLSLLEYSIVQVWIILSKLFFNVIIILANLIEWDLDYPVIQIVLGREAIL